MDGTYKNLSADVRPTIRERAAQHWWFRQLLHDGGLSNDRRRRIILKIKVTTSKDAVIFNELYDLCDYCKNDCQCLYCLTGESEDAECTGYCECASTSPRSLMGSLDKIELDIDLDGEDFAAYADFLPKGSTSTAKMFADKDGFWTEVTYIVSEPVDLARLVKYTLGQMSDGIGEGYEQFQRPIFGLRGYLVSMWSIGMTATAKVVDKKKQPRCRHKAHGECLVVVAPTSMYAVIKCPFCNYTVTPSSPYRWCSGCFTVFEMLDGMVHFGKNLPKTFAMSLAMSIERSGGASFGTKDVD